MLHQITSRWIIQLLGLCLNPAQNLRCKDDGQSTDISRESKGEMAELAWRAPFHVKPQKQPKISNSLKNKLLARLSCSLTLSTGRQRQEGLWFI